MVDKTVIPTGPNRRLLVGPRKDAAGELEIHFSPEIRESISSPWHAAHRGVSVPVWQLDSFLRAVITWKVMVEQNVWPGGVVEGADQEKGS